MGIPKKLKVETMSKKSSVSLSALTNLYNELNSAGSAEDYEKAIKVSNKILSLDKTAVKAFQYKIVCLIHLEKFQDVLKQLRSCSAKMSSGLQFERAYCEYRENDLVAALNTLSACEESTVRLNQLRGQVLYRMERYSEAFELFKDVVKNTDDDFNDERQTNLVAVQAQIQFQREQKRQQQQQQCGDMSASGEKPIPLYTPPANCSSYELLYNCACQLVATNQLAAAASLLKRTAALCRQQLQEEGADPATVHQEVAVIDTQLAYCKQCLGEETEAASLYHETLRHRPSDSAVAATIANNIVALNRQRSVFDSRKRMRVLASTDTVARLSGWQKRQLTINQCVFNCLTRQTEQMEKHLTELCDSAEGDSVLAALIRAALLARTDCHQADQLLLDQLSSDGAGTASSRTLQLRLARAQLRLNKGEFESASRLLGELEESERSRPGVVAARVALCSRSGQYSQAADVIADAVKHKCNEERVLELWSRAADLQMRCSDWPAAAKTLQKLVDTSKCTEEQRQRLLAQLVIAYCHLDREKAVRLATRLKADGGVGGAGGTVDVAALESAGWCSNTRAITKRAGVAIGGRSPYGDKKQQSPSSPDSANNRANNSESRPRRKRKPRLPQNYNLEVTPDPERWLPRRQRTAYRPRRRARRHDVMKGTQGGPAAHSDLYDITKTAPQQKLSPAVDQSASRNVVNRNVQKKRRQGKRSSRW